MAKGKSGKRWALAALPGLLGFAITVALLYPGFFSCCDQTWQLEQARKNIYHDWHPPMMAFVWRYLDGIVKGTGGYFLLNATLFWSGFGVLLNRFVRNAPGRVAIAILYALTPVNLSLLGQLMKDTSVAAGWMAFIALGVKYAASKRAVWLLPAFVLLIYLSGLRHNAAPLVLLGAVWLAGLWARRHRLRLRGFVGASVGLATGLAAIGLQMLLVDQVIQPVRNRTYQVLLGFDVIGVSRLSGVDYLPEFYTRPPEGLPRERILAQYTPATISTLFFGMGGYPRVPMAWVDAGAVDSIAASWRRAVAEQPAAYLKHRAANFMIFLGLRPHGGMTYGPLWSESRYIDGTGGNESVRRALDHWIREHAESLWFKPWVYLLALVFALALLLRRRFLATVASAPGKLVVLPALASLAYVLAYAWIGISNEFYYAFPLLPGLLAIAVALSGGKTKRRVFSKQRVPR